MAVFTNLSHQEKDAFFALLDEYFDSRPDLFKGVSGANQLDTPAHRAVAASAVQHAFSGTSSPSSVRWKKSSEPADTASSVSSVEETLSPSAGRVAAAAAAFQKSGAGPAFLRQGSDAGTKGTFGSLRNSTIGKAPAPPKIEEPEEDPRTDGEMAEVLYDYTPEDPSDLEIKEGERILIVEKPSDDWWMGEIGTKRGLVPAAYVRVY